MFAGVNFCLALLVYFIVPETKQVKLEEIETLFVGVKHVEKGANLLSMASRETSIARPGGAQHVDLIDVVRDVRH